MQRVCKPMSQRTSGEAVHQKPQNHLGMLLLRLEEMPESQVLSVIEYATTSPHSSHIPKTTLSYVNLKKNALK